MADETGDQEVRVLKARSVISLRGFGLTFRDRRQLASLCQTAIIFRGSESASLNLSAFMHEPGGVLGRAADHARSDTDISLAETCLDVATVIKGQLPLLRGTV